VLTGAADGDYHRSLLRQLRRLRLDPATPPDGERWLDLLRQVSTSYRDADEDRYLLERSVEVSSQEMRALHDALSQRVRRDALTGLPNRIALTEAVDGALGGRHRIALLFIDLDGFKLVNDSLGHAAGDELLIRVAERVLAAVRTGDVVARLGGDEFVVTCAGVDNLSEAGEVATRVSAALEAPFRIGSQDVVIGASIGIALTEPRSCTADELLRRADLAMYRAKLAGRSRVVVFDEQMQLEVESRLVVENALWRAVREDELRVFYQPIVTLSDEEVVGYEALVRWQRPGHGLVAPDQFIPVAEMTRLITAVDGWVLRNACRQAAGWTRPDLLLTVNLSARDLADSELAEVVVDALSSSGLRPGRLVLELTETTLMARGPAGVATLDRLRKLGIQIAIDDFGTGYSSLSSLRDLPATTLKIDRSFIATVDRDTTAASIVGAIITMALALRLTVVAEGVERPTQAALLRSLGCERAQGYLFGRPDPAAQPVVRPARAAAQAG
jgi:diguanylate cyclase (GGDEF)-like protein